jgi:hypothetical protein
LVYSAITQKFFPVRRLDAPRPASLQDDPAPLDDKAKVVGGRRHDKRITNKIPSGLDREIRASLGQLSRTEFFACDA